MRIYQVQVKNYSRLTDIELNVGKHLVLVGANNVGKSSLLTCLDWALGASMSRLYSDLDRDDFRDNSQPLIIRVSCNDLSDEDAAAFPDEIHTDESGNNRSLTIQLYASMDEAGTIEISRTSAKEHLRRQISRDQLNRIGWKLLNATGSRRDIRAGRDGVIDDILSTVNLGDESAAFDSIWQKFEETVGASSTLATLRKDIGGKLLTVLPPSLSWDEVKIVSQRSEDNPLAATTLAVENEGIARPLYEQSDGIRAITAIALHDLRHSGASMIAIDEPEVHLHPSSQRALGKLLARGKSQKIIATHSSDIVAQFDPLSIAVIRGDGFTKQCKNTPWDPMEKQFAQWWIRDRLEPLTSEHVIAVEGVADRIILEACAENTGRLLDRLNTSIIDAGGCGNMGAIWKLFGPDGFDTDLQILIDDDLAVKQVCQALKIKASEFAEYNITLSSKDLEDEYVRAIGAAEVAKALAKHVPYGVRRAAGVLEEDHPSEDNMRAFCGSDKWKVTSAMCVSSVITSANARSIASIETVLSKISSGLL